MQAFFYWPHSQYFLFAHLILNSDSCQTALNFHIHLLMQKILSFQRKASAWPDPHYLLDKLASTSKPLLLFKHSKLFTFGIHYWASWHVLDTKQSKLVYGGFNQIVIFVN